MVRYAATPANPSKGKFIDIKKKKKKKNWLFLLHVFSCQVQRFLPPCSRKYFSTHII
jgi:hypothetical protein